MTWEDSLENLKTSAERDTWINNFNKIFEIYSGKVKGLRNLLLRFANKWGRTF